MFRDINWYGQLDILCRYLKIKTQIPFASIQHGYISKKELNQSEARNLKFVPFLVWNDKIKSSLNLKKDFNVRIIGAPFIYIDKILKKYDFKAKGSLVMLIHSENTLEQKLVSKTILKKIRNNYPGPHTISLFYDDYNKTKIKYYKENGFKVVTFGPRSNKNHLINLFKSIKLNEYFITDYVGSSFFYALFLKKKTKLIKNKYKFNVSTKEQRFYKKFLKNLDEERNTILRKYSRFKFIPIKDGYKLACTELGFKYFKTRSELINHLGLNSLLKKSLALFGYKIRPKFLYYKNFSK